MSSFLRRRFSYANVAATMALVFAMGGSAVAARHYLISSTRQISPKVLRALKGNGATGPRGAVGARGNEGPPGTEGPQGKPGAVGPTFSAHAGEDVPKGIGRLSAIKALTVNLPSPGNLMVSGSFYGVVECMTGTGTCASGTLFLAVDGVAVPGSAVALGNFPEKGIGPKEGDQVFSTSGRLSGVSAGKHTIAFEIGDLEEFPGTMTALTVGLDGAQLDITLTG
jgi:hypothetical protein